MSAAHKFRKGLGLDPLSVLCVMEVLPALVRDRRQRLCEVGRRKQLDTVWILFGLAALDEFQHAILSFESLWVAGRHESIQQEETVFVGAFDMTDQPAYILGLLLAAERLPEYTVSMRSLKKRISQSHLP